MAESLDFRIGIAIEAAESATTIGELKKAMKDLKSLSLEASTSNQEAFQRVNQAIGDQADRVSDLNAAYKSLSGEPIENVSKSFNGLKQSLMSLDLKGAKVQFANLMTSVGTLGSSILGLNQGLNLSTIAMRGFGAALAATGIGAIAVVLGVIVANFDKIAASGGLLGDIFKSVGKIVEQVTDYVLGLLDAIGLVDKAEMDRQKNAKKGAEEAEAWMSRNADKYDEFTQRKLKADVDYKKEVVKLNEDTTKSEVEKQNILKELQDRRNREIIAADKDRADKQKESDEELRKKRAENAEKARKKAEEELKKEVDDFNRAAKQKEDTDRQFYKARRDEEALIREFNVTSEEIEKRQNELRVEYAWMTFDEINAVIKEELKARKDANDKRIQDELEARRIESLPVVLPPWQQAVLDGFKAVEEKRKEDIEKVKTYAKEQLTVISDLARQLNTLGGDIVSGIANTTNTLIDNVKVFAEESTASVYEKIAAGLAIAGSAVNEIGNILGAESDRRLKQIEDEKNAELASLEGRKNRGLITEAQYQKGKEDIQKKARAKEEKEKRKAFNQDKAVRIVETIIATAQAVVTSLTAGPIVGPILAAIAGAAGAAQVALIAAQKYPEGGGGSGGGGAAPAVPMPSSTSTAPPEPTFQGPEFFGLGQNNLLAGGAGGSQKVFVVESEISATQGRVARIKERSTLGE